MKKYIHIIILLSMSLSAFGQNAIETQQNGTWLDPNVWYPDPGVANPPDGSWANGKTIYIGNIINIADETIIDLSSSQVELIRLFNGGVIVFGQNSQLILPENARIVIGNGAQIDATNNGSNTGIKIGETRVWGKSACSECNDILYGYGVLDKNSDPDGTLPIKLLSFSGTAQTSTIQLDWVTAWEENFDFFTVERAGANLKFEAIGTLKGKGNTAAEVPYSFTDKNPLQGQAFYRLKATDFDGSIEYHKIISVYFDGFPVTETKVYPNPVTNHSLKLETSEASVSEVSLLDLSGRVVFSQKIQMGINEISLPEMIRPGAYILVVLGNQEKQYQQKIMVL